MQMDHVRELECYQSSVEQIIASLRATHAKDIAALRTENHQLRVENSQLKRDLRNMRTEVDAKAVAARKALEKLEQSIEGKSGTAGCASPPWPAEPQPIETSPRATVAEAASAQTFSRFSGSNDRQLSVAACDRPPAVLEFDSDLSPSPLRPVQRQQGIGGDLPIRPDSI